MQPGGIESWLMEVLRRENPLEVRHELLLHSAEVGAYDAELRELGIAVWRCPPPGQPLAFARCFLGTLRAGHYDIVHSHVHFFSGAVLALSALAGVPGRLAHSHTDSAASDAQAGRRRSMYLRLMRGLIRMCASEGLAVSQQAADALFGPDWPRRRVMALGLDTHRLREAGDPLATRRALNIAPDALLIGHVGRFVREKNHAFLLEVFAELLRLRPDARLLLVGGGELRGEVRAQAEALGLAESVIFAGLRQDIPALLGVMDVFVLPSYQEGLGLALIEAQLAGVPCLSAGHLPPESRLGGSSLCILPLSAGAPRWARALLEVAQEPRRFPENHAYDLADAMTHFRERYERYRR